MDVERMPFAYYQRLSARERADSFHTEGFFRRESSLFHQLVPEAGAGTAGGSPAGPQ